MTERIGAQPSVLLVNPMDRIRPETEKLTAKPVTDNVDMRVLLPEKCRPHVDDALTVTYRFYDAQFVPNIRYTLPGMSFLRTLQQEAKAVDVVHTFGYVYLPSLLSTMVTPSAETSTVITVDAFPGKSWSYGNRFVDAVAKAYTSLFAQRMFSAADAVVGLGEYCLTDFEDFIEREEKISIIPNGVDTDEYSPARSQQPMVQETDSRPDLVEVDTATDGSAERDDVDLLYVGRLDTVKGVSYLLDALSMLSAYEQPFTLTIVGDGSRRADWEARCRDLGLAEHVSFEGWQDDVIPYYRAHDILVLPSVSEGLPTVITEAQACGLPVVSTDVGGASEQVRGGKIVPTKDANALADAIGAIARTDLRHRGAVARKHVLRNYSLTEMAESYVQLYETFQD